MTGATIASSPLLFILIGIGLLAIIAYSLFCYRKARARCLELGISAEAIRNVVKRTITFSIVPSLAIAVGLITLSVSQGVAWPWWRLSVIGSLSYELLASGFATDGMKVAPTEVLGGDPSIFVTVMFVMTIGVLYGTLLCVLVAKKYSTGIMKAKATNEWGTILAGVFFLAMLAVYIPATLLGDAVQALTMVTGAVLMVGMGAIAKKVPRFGDFVMPISLLGALVSSVLWVHLFA